MTSNPWDIPEFESLGDAHPDRTYTAVGRALSYWEYLEYQLSRFFTVFVGRGSDGFAAQRAYGAVLTFRGRIDLLRAAASVHFQFHPNPKIEERFKALLNRAQSFSPRRNEIAHGIVKPFGLSDGSFSNCLMPPEYMTNKNPLSGEFSPDWLGTEPRYMYGSAEIGRLTVHFRALANLAHELMFDWLDQSDSQDIEPSA